MFSGGEEKVIGRLDVLNNLPSRNDVVPIAQRVFKRVLVDLALEPFRSLPPRHTFRLATLNCES